MQKSYQDLNIQFLPDNIIKEGTFETTDSLISHINNLTHSLSPQLLSIVDINFL